MASGPRNRRKQRQEGEQKRADTTRDGKCFGGRHAKPECVAGARDRLVPKPSFGQQAREHGEDRERNAGFTANAAEGAGAAVEQREDGEHAETEPQPEPHARSFQAKRSRARSWAFRASSRGTSPSCESGDTVV